MSSTCNVTGCRNDRRAQLKHRQIEMPHIWKLRFHKSRHDDIKAWQVVFNSNRGDKKYRVSNGTSVCSNHFRKGEYNKGDVSCLFLQGYPEWASSRDDLRKKAASLDAAIVHEVAAHAFQYVLHSEATVQELLHELQKKHNESGKHFETDAGFLNTILNADPDAVCDVLCDSLHLFPLTAKLQEAIAIYKHGVLIKNASIIKKTRKQSVPATHDCDTSIEQQEEDMVILYSISDCHNFCSVPYVHPPSSENGDISKLKLKLCTKKRCLNKKKMLKRSASVLKAKMIGILKENKELKKKKKCLSAKVKYLETELKHNRNINRKV